MNPAKQYAHLFSPKKPEDSGGYGTIGQLSFVRGEHVPLKAAALKKTKARYAFIGVPFEEGNVGKPGAEEGPREFRIASLDYFPYWFEYEVDLNGYAVDCGDVIFLKVNPKDTYERVYRAVREILKGGLVPVVCGGDRSISVPAARALSDHLGAKKKMGVLHFGASLDMADSWAGSKALNVSAMARITELKNVAGENATVIGVRNSMNPKDYFDLAKKRKLKFYSMFEMLDRGIGVCAQEAIDRVWNGTHGQYLSFNFNVLDASVAPGVSAAEPGGLESRELVKIIDMIGAKKGVSVIDVTELNPIFDVAGNTSRLAVGCILRLMAAIARARGETVDQKLRRR